MCKAARNEKLPAVLPGETNRDVAAERVRSCANVYCDIKHFTFDYAHKLGLRCIASLKMKSADDAVLRKGFVVLNERSLDAELSERLCVPGFKKVAAGIFKDMRLQNDAARKFRVDASLTTRVRAGVRDKAYPASSR